MSTATIIEYTGDVFVEVSDTIAERYLLNGYVTRTEQPDVFLLASPAYDRGISPEERAAAAHTARHNRGVFAKVTGTTWDECPVGDLNLTCENGD